MTGPLAGNPDIDFVVVREGTEGPYTGTGGAIRVGTPNEIATEVSVNTAFGVRRVVHDAFRRAQQRRKHLTLVHKNNVLTFAGDLWWRTVQEIAAEEQISESEVRLRLHLEKRERAVGSDDVTIESYLRLMI